MIAFVFVESSALVVGLIGLGWDGMGCLTGVCSGWIPFTAYDLRLLQLPWFQFQLLWLMKMIAGCCWIFSNKCMCGLVCVLLETAGVRGNLFIYFNNILHTNSHSLVVVRSSLTHSHSPSETWSSKVSRCVMFLYSMCKLHYTHAYRFTYTFTYLLLTFMHTLLQCSKHVSTKTGN